MKAGILGAGSVGLGVAASLVKTGARVTLLTRGKSLDALKADGLRVGGVLGTHDIPPREFAVEDAAASFTPLDLLIVTTKTYEVAPALKAMAPAFREKTPALLLLQNGWGSAEEARAAMPAGTPVFSGSVMSGLERISPSEVRILAHVDAVKAGSLFGDDIGRLAAFIDISKKGFIPFAPEPAIEPVMLAKLLYNICLNPLGALLGSTYGELLRSEAALGLMYRIAEEGVRVLKEVRGFSRFASGEAYVREVLVEKFLPKIAAHRSSMLQDIENGRRTEIGYLNGAIAAIGRSAGVATPCNETIISLIRTAEEKQI
ncbi:MAG: ketopantoate reductase family protein [Bdellovibrionales bacterium]